ncbi:MAG: hypothetical protein ACYDHD_03680, partial [Vulcanimicrobiaceae bacterium]
MGAGDDAGDGSGAGDGTSDALGGVVGNAKWSNVTSAMTGNVRNAACSVAENTPCVMSQWPSTVEKSRTIVMSCCVSVSAMRAGRRV